MGETVRGLIFRDGDTMTLRVTLGRRDEAEGAVPAAAPAPAEPEAPQSLETLGLTLMPLNDEMRAELGLGEDINGLAVTAVDEASEAFEKGLRAGDVITEAGQQAVGSIKDFEARMDEVKQAGRKSLLLLVRRGGDPRFIALGLDQG